MLKFFAHKLIESLDWISTVIDNSIDDISNPDYKDILHKHVEFIKNQAELFNLKVSHSQATKIIDMLNENEPLDIEMLREIDRLKEVLIIELENILFLAIPSKGVDYYNYNNTKTFQKIIDKFPSAEFNLTEAAKCFALGRYTACVFHLMLLLETPLNVFAKEVGVDIDRNNNWGGLLDHIEKEVNKMDYKTIQDRKNKEYYSQLISNFRPIKTGWRNYTMHGNNKYTEENAQRIFSNVEGFMKELTVKFTEN